MGIKVSQMPSTNTLTDNDLVMVVQDNENKKINKKDLQNNLTDPSLTKRVEELEKENAYLNNLVEQAFDKKEVEGEELSINDTIEAKMNVSLYGNTKQETTTGKNLLPITRNKGYSVTSNGVTFTINDDYSVSIKGTATATASISLVTTSIPFTLKAGTYTLSKGTKSKEQLAIWYGDSSILRAVTDDTDTSTFTINQNTTYERFRTLVVVYKDVTVDDIIYPMLEQGSTATPYEPFTNGASPNPDYPQKIQRVTGNNSVSITGKNLLPNNLENKTVGGVTITTNNNNSFNLKGTSTRGIGLSICNNITLKANKYTLSANHIPTGVFISLDNKGYSMLNSNTFKISFTLTEDTTFNKCFLWIEQGITLDDTFEVQLEIGNQTEYKPYQNTKYPISLGNIELCKIGDYQDYFYKNNNKWYKREVIGSVTLDGSENWYLAERTDTNNGVIYIDYSTIGRSDFSNKGAYSNYAKFTTSFSTKVGQFDTHYSQWRFYAPTNTITVNEWKTMLNTTNLQLKYIKSESSDIEITDTTLISQLEALKKAMSYTEQTNISQINNDIPFILKVTALASYNSRIVALENAILNANRSAQTENTRKSNKVIEETKKEVVDK